MKKTILACASAALACLLALARTPPETAFRRTPYVGAIAVDAATGRVLFERNADVVARPASVTKLMTLLKIIGTTITNLNHWFIYFQSNL